MNLPFGFLLFGLAFFLIAALVSVVRARRKGEKIYYMSAVVSFLMTLAFVFIFINQLLPVIFLMVAAGLLSVVGLPKMSKVLKREWAKILHEADLSAPLRERDFLTMKGWLKLASRWGVWKTVFLYWLLNVAIIGGALFTLSLWGIMSITYVATYTIASTTVSAIIFYQQISSM